ncbi:ABC transporter ATP-binding protein [Clostridiaceae bacterium M8S5]|nr:ABC transporter ATP-binding protein [Clostridiaceae bacterium M8S5]
MNDKLLEIKDLDINYYTSEGVVKAVNGIDLVINKGETIGLVGETGAGKTTTALGIMRLLQSPPAKIDGGQILIDGQDILKLSEDEMRMVRSDKVSMIFQDPMTALNPVLTVIDQVAEVIEIHQDVTTEESFEKAGEMLEKVGIPKERGKEYPHQFSGGMKQRVIIAIALACNPHLLLADEPTTALDVTIQAQVLDMMRQLKAQFNTSVLFITHDLGVVAEICDKVAIMYAGEIIEFGTLEDIFENTKHPYTIGLFNSIPKIDEDVKVLQPIEGNIADPMNLPSGCRFHPRCNHASKKCKEQLPKSTSIGDEHIVKCFLYETNQKSQQVINYAK